MNYLGINISHEVSVAYFKDHELINIWYEDRYNFDKHWEPTGKDSFYLSLLKNINFKPDFVCYGSYDKRNSEWYGKDNDEVVIKKIQQQLDNPPYFFTGNEHHVYHALCGKHFSPFKEAMAIVIDAGGAQTHKPGYQEMQSIYYVSNNFVKKLWCHYSCRSFLELDGTWKHGYAPVIVKNINGTECEFSALSVGANEFNRVGFQLGFRGGKDAGKVMGLAAYADSKKKYDLDYSKVTRAKELQEETFEQTCKIIEKAYKYKNLNNFILSGGYFLNCTNNFKYVKKYPNLNFFVDPIAWDGGISIGAHLYYHEYNKRC